MNKKLRMLSAVTLVVLSFVSIAAADKWETNFEKARTKAKESNRYMLLNFSGSDWCGWCIKLDKEVFSKKEFKEYASENLVIVELDYPRKTPQKSSLKEQNEKLAKEYGIKGFPTVLILSPSGELVAKTGYQDGGPEKYVEHLQGFINSHRRKNNVPAPTVVPAGPAHKRRSTRGVPASVIRQWEQQAAESEED